MTACRPQRASGFDEEVLALLRPRLVDYLTAACGVELRQRGSRLIGRCPVHDDTAPSFAVFGSHHETCGCFPCGFNGDAFAVSQWLGRASTFPEAVHDVAAVLGVHLPQSTAVTATRPATAQPRPAKQPETPFALSTAERETVHAARLAFSDAFHGGDSVVDEIAASLGFDRETLRLASWGSCGLGIGSPDGKRPSWLCYAYPTGLKWRNPDPGSKPRFQWIVGKATAPWRMGWAARPEVQTVYLTEGESDALAIIAAGIEDDGSAVAVASPGTSFLHSWAPMFSGKRVVICFDKDEAGRTATRNVAELLRGHAAEIQQWRGAQ